MDFVAVLCQGFAQFGGYYATTAKGGVAHDSYFDFFHLILLSVVKTYLAAIKFRKLGATIFILADAPRHQIFFSQSSFIKQL